MDKDEKEIKHPSYGLVQFSRRSGNPKLFATAVDQHYNYITLSVSQATLIRGPSGDRYFGGLRGDLIEVDLSAAQFAELLTTMNVGMGVPCTVTYVKGERVEEPPSIETETQNIKTEYETKIQAFANEAAESAKRVRDLLDKQTLNKADRYQIKDAFDKVVRELIQNAPFFLEMFREATERVSTAAKAEADAWLTAAIHQAGIKALQTGETLSVPELPEASSK